MEKVVLSKKKKIIIAVITIIFCLIFVGILMKIDVICNRGCRARENEDLHIDTSHFVDITTKNNIDLCQWAIMAYNENWGYVYGTWGNRLTQTAFVNRLEQYPAIVGEHQDFIQKNYMGKRVVDCAGLIKGYCWYSPNSSIIEYCGGTMPDLGANKMFENSTENGEIQTIPEIPGLAVWADGHIGVYIGNGWVIEAKSTLDGVCKTRLQDRPWTHWCKLPYIEYNDSAKLPETQEEPQRKKG